MSQVALQDNALLTETMEDGKTIHVTDNTARNSQLTPFKPGKDWKGNAKGRPKGSRNAVSEAFLQDLHKVWAKQGLGVLEHVAANEPSKLLAAMVQVLPKDFQVSVDVDQVNWVINASPRLSESEWREQHGLNTIEQD